jgi:GH24 family phage-related lysozyme (muramidase)
MAAPQASLRGEALIQKWEGLFLKAYLDPVGVLTIGYGTISNKQLGINVRPGMVISKEKAVEWMRVELRQQEQWMANLIKVPLTQYQWDCLDSFVFNVGIGNFKRSTLLKKLNKGDYASVPSELLKWTKARDRRTNKYVTLRGLLNRRNDEARMWNNHHIEFIPPPEIVVVRQEDTAPEDKTAIAKTITLPEVSKPVQQAGFWATVSAGATYIATQVGITSLPSQEHMIAYGALGAAFVAGYATSSLVRYVRSKL